MKAFLPNNLNLTGQLEFSPPTFDFHPDNFKYICSLINEVPSYTKGIYSDHDFVNLNATKLQSCIHEYRSYVDYLIENNILECDYHFIKGEKSMGYRFVETFRTPVVAVDLKKTSLQKRSRKVSAYNFRMQDKYDHLYKWFNSDLCVDYSGALDYLKQSYVANKEGGVENVTRKFNSSFISLHKLANQEYYFSIDHTAGRCHTNLTCLKSELRNFVTYNGQPLVSIDIKNSQPCFSGLLLNPEFYRDCKKSPGPLLSLFGDKIALKSELEANSIKYINKSLSSHMLEESAHTTGDQPLGHFLKIVQNGTLYEFIALQGGLQTEDRKELKEIVFTALFTDNRFIAQKEAGPKRLFKKMFPPVYEVFAIIKKHDSTLLAKLLQRIEARVMLKHVAKRISKEKPEMPLFTIHDSIVCPKGYEHYVGNIIEQEMILRVGMRPTLSYEEWSPSKLTYPTLRIAA